MRYEPLLKAHLKALFAAFGEATGLPETTIGRIVARDTKYLNRSQGAAITTRTYDRIASRFSGLWPDGCPWPDSVPRPDGGDLEPEVRAEYRDEVHRRYGVDRETALNWPSDVPWPAHLPRPTDHQPAQRKA